MKRKEERKFSTLDIYLSAFLELYGITADLENHNGRVVFVFLQSDELYRFSNAYNSNEPVPVADYVSALRTLKARMFAKREKQSGKSSM